MVNIEDQVLIRAFLLSKNELVFRQLYRKHTPAVYRVALYLNNNNVADTEDIVQEVWIRAVEKLNAFEWRSSFKTWLSGIAINCCREHKRKKMFVGEDAAAKLDFQNTVESKIDIHNALSLLPEGYKEMIILHDLEGFTHKEIGSLLGVNEGTSKSQLFQARKALKKMLTEKTK